MFVLPHPVSWPCGAMDNASAYGAEDSRFESWQGRTFSTININFKDFSIAETLFSQRKVYA